MISVEHPGVHLVVPQNYVVKMVQLTKTVVVKGHLQQVNVDEIQSGVIRQTLSSFLGLLSYTATAPLPPQLKK